MHEPHFPGSANEGFETNPNDPPWNSAVAVGFWLLSVFLVFIVPGLMLLPYVFTRGSQGMDAQQIAEFATKDPMAIVIQMAAILPVHIVTLAVGWFVVTKGRKFPFFETLGWRSGGVRWWHYVVILGGFFALAAVVGHYLPEKENDLLRILKSSRMAVYLVAFFAVVTAPFVEELVYRGVLFSSFQRSIGTPAAIGLVTVLFALVHLPQYYPSFSTMILLTLLSFILTVMRAKTGNLLPCVVLHTVFNAIQSLLLLLNPELSPAPSAPMEQAVFFFIPK